MIEYQSGFEADYYEGKFNRAYPVKQSTFLSYLSSLVKQGRILRILEDHEVVPRYWGQAAWAEEIQLRQLKEKERIRSLSGKIDEHMEIETIKPSG